MKKSCVFNLRVSLELIDRLETEVKQEKFKSVSDAIRQYCDLGIKVESFKTSIKDPEFIKSIGELKQTDGVFQWIETLTDEQTDAIAYALQMEKEKRCSTRKIR